MSRRACASPIAFATLVEYWLGELAEPVEAGIEEHFLGCEACAAELAGLIDAGQGIRRGVERGLVQAIVTGAFVRRLAREGLRVREYRVPPNGSVECTAAPEDDVVVSRMEAPLSEVERVDLLLYPTEGSEAQRLEDVPFDAASGEVLMTQHMGVLRALPATKFRMELVAVGEGKPRLLGEYLFVHTPWKSRT